MGLKKFTRFPLNEKFSGLSGLVPNYAICKREKLRKKLWFPVKLHVTSGKSLAYNCKNFCLNLYCPKKILNCNGKTHFILHWLCEIGYHGCTTKGFTCFINIGFLTSGIWRHCSVTSIILYDWKSALINRRGEGKYGCRTIRGGHFLRILLGHFGTKFCIKNQIKCLLLDDYLPV